MSSVDAISPFTLTCAPCPKNMPFGLMRNTLPLDCSKPRMIEGFCPVMRFNTELLLLCWLKITASLPQMENFCQLIIVLGELVIVREWSCVVKAALPYTTC